MPKTSPLLEKEKIIPEVKLSSTEEEYRSALLIRLRKARDERNRPFDELDGMTWIEYIDSNRKGMTSFIPPKQNKEDTRIVTGTTRQKALTFLAVLNNLNLLPDLQAFDQSNLRLVSLGEAIEDIDFKLSENDRDEEKRLVRQYTMLEQGTVFVQDSWVEKFRTEKQLNKKFKGQVKDIDWTSRLKKVFDGPSRNVVRNEDIYLGNMSLFDNDDQPFMFTAETISRDEAESMFGKWERWKFVSTAETDEAQKDNGIFGSRWSLNTLSEGQIEIIKYQSVPDNEYQIILNGTPMMPIGFPLPWGLPKYNITKQVLEVIHSHFPLGKSLVQRLRTLQEVEDEMIRLMVLKTQKEFMPPRGNMTGRVLSPRIFMPAKITQGINADQVKPLSDANGISNSEVQMLGILKQSIDESTVNPTFQGQNPTGSPTATQIVEVQKQAQAIANLVVFSAAQLEKKLAEFRLGLILENWFDPIDTTIDEARGVLIDRFRSVGRERNIAGQGKGVSVVRATDANPLPSSKAVKAEEDRIFEETGQPTKLTFINGEQLRQANLIWYYNVHPKPKTSDPLNKVMFTQMVTEALNIFGPASLNFQHLQERFAVTWEENPSKVFKQGEDSVPMALLEAQGGTGKGNATLKNQLSPKSPPIPSINTLTKPR